MEIKISVISSTYSHMYTFDAEGGATEYSTNYGEVTEAGPMIVADEKWKLDKKVARNELLRIAAIAFARHCNAIDQLYREYTDGSEGAK